MILFADNDIFLKLTGCGLLQDFIDCLSLTQQQIYVAPTLKFSIRGQMNKSFHGEQAESAKNTLSQFLNKVNVSEELAADEQQTFLDTLSVFPKIDPGEAILLTHAYFNPASKIATGDKNCLKAVIKANNLTDLQQSLQGRVYTLEMAMLILIERMGFEAINAKVSNRCIEDMVLKMAFGENRSQENAVMCLSSYTKELISLLAEPQLIIE